MAPRRGTRILALVAALTTPAACSSEGELVSARPASAAGGDEASSSSGASSSGASSGGGGGSPAPAPQPVILQAYYWDVPHETPAGSWWKNLEAKAPELAAAGITAAWIPPPGKGGAGIDDVGYGVYDRYDLGEFDQKGTVRTRYGTLAELDAAVAALHAQKIAVYADVVLNHMMGADYVETVTTLGNQSTSVKSGFSFPGRGAAHSAYTWSAQNFNGCQQGGWKQWHAWDFAPYNGGDAWDNLLGCEIRYAHPGNRAEMIAWGKWLTSRLALDGYRVDAVKHVVTDYINEWLDAVVGGRFVVSEFWSGNVAWLEAYAKATGGRTRLFDVPTHYALSAMSAGDGGWDMRQLKPGGFSGKNGELSVTFVDNHDTVEGGALYSPVENFKAMAYAYILLRAEGVPTVFYKDYYEYGYGAEIAELIAIRNSHAGGAGREYDESTEDVYVYSRDGDAARPGLLLLLDDGPKAASRALASTPFPNTTLVDRVGGGAPVTTDAKGGGTFTVPARGYSIWVPKAP